MTDPDWCRENPREAATEIDRLRTALRHVEEALTDAPELQDNENVRRAEKLIEDALAH